jgi:aminoglycoside 6'-N-acetyltransferase I
MRILDLDPSDRARIDAVAEILFDSFRELSPEYLPTIDSARETVDEGFGDDKLSRVLLDDDGVVLGWAGGVHLYGALWEIHPLAVAASARRHGVGRRLVEDIERAVAARGALTLHVSTSDESGRTNLFGRDLYDDPLGALRDLRSVREHPIDFWRKLGYALVGVMPDAEGPGMPSIHFAKRVRR